MGMNGAWLREEVQEVHHRDQQRVERAQSQIPGITHSGILLSIKGAGKPGLNPRDGSGITRPIAKCPFALCLCLRLRYLSTWHLGHRALATPGPVAPTPGV